MSGEEPQWLAEIKADGAAKRYRSLDVITRSHVRHIRRGLRAGGTLAEIQRTFEETCANWRPSIRAVHLVDVYRALGYAAAHKTNS